MELSAVRKQRAYESSKKLHAYGLWSSPLNQLTQSYQLSLSALLVFGTERIKR